MKMKMYKYIAIMALLAFSACSIDRDPLDQLSAGQFWKSQDDFDMGMTAIYGKLQTAMFSSGTPDWDLITDNAYGQHNSNNCRDLVSRHLPQSTLVAVSWVYNSACCRMSIVSIFVTVPVTCRGESPTA